MYRGFDYINAEPFGTFFYKRQFVFVQVARYYFSFVSGADGGIKALSAGTRACVEQAFPLFHAESLAAYLRSLVLHEKEVLKAQELFIGNVFRHTDAARRIFCRLGMNSFILKHFYKFFP